MSAYATLAVWFTAGAALIAAALGASSRSRPLWRAVGATALVLCGLTAVFDNLMIASRLFLYEREHLLGPLIGLAPVEDFAYPIAGALLLPAVWERMRARRAEEDDR